MILLNSTWQHYLLFWMQNLIFQFHLFWLLKTLGK